MKQPLNRDHQIELIDNVKTRLDSRVTKFLGVRIINESISKGHKYRQEEKPFTSEKILRSNCG